MCEQPQFCKVNELAKRLGLPADFLYDSACAGRLCYINLMPDDCETAPYDPRDWWYFNVEIAAQEILHTARLSRPPNMPFAVPNVVEVGK